MGLQLELRESETLEEALRADFELAKKRGVGAAGIAVRFGKSPEWVYALVKGGVPFPMELIGVWVELTGGVRLGLWLGRAMGGVFTRVSPASAPGADMAGTAEVAREFSEHLQAVADTFADGVVTWVEARRVRREGEELVARVMKQIFDVEGLAAAEVARRRQVRVNGGRAKSLAACGGVVATDGARQARGMKRGERMR